ncbi:MAG: NUDIX domain-containing protein [Microthrixaceae bacterium]
MSLPAIHVCALLQQGDEFLMLRRRSHWSLPDGSVNLGETLAEAVARVLEEQVGLSDAICGPFIGWSETVEAEVHGPHILRMYFQAVILDQAAVPASEIAEVSWIPSWDAAELGLTDGLAEFLSDHGLIETMV